MIDFFTKTLSGTTYIIVLIVCIILILALIGVMSEVKYMKTIDTPSKNVSKKEEKKTVSMESNQNQLDINNTPSVQTQMNTIVPPVPQQVSTNQSIVTNTNQEHMN